VVKLTIYNKLTSKFVQTAPVGDYHDGQGLYLHKTSKRSHNWTLRYYINRKRKEMGLGGTETSLKEARDIASEYRKMSKAGIDPKAHRQREKLRISVNQVTVEDLTYSTFDAKKNSLKGEGNNGKWLSPLINHALPKLGKLPISSINQHMIKDLIQPIWHTKNPTAVKVLNRLNIIFRHAAAQDIDVDLQAVEKAKLLLGQSKHVERHVKAVDWRIVPEFYQSLDEERITHIALKMLIITGQRGSPLTKMNLSEIENNIWTKKGDDLKGLKGKTPDFRIPLGEEALRLIELAKPHARHGWLFVGPRGKPITVEALEKIMKQRGMDERPHGFRSTLKTWVLDNDIASIDIAEQYIGHSIENKVGKAYTRTDRFEKRLALQNAWVEYLNKGFEYG
jgi:integrase